MKHFVSSNGRDLNASEQSLKLILPSVYEMALLWTQINQSLPFICEACGRVSLVVKKVDKN